MKNNIDREHWYTAQDIVTLLGSLNEQNNYRVEAPINHDDLWITQTISGAVHDIQNGVTNTIAIPVNMGNRHWAGLVLRNNAGTIEAHYNDSLGNAMQEQIPALYQALLNNNIDLANIHDHQVIQQYNNYDCGPWTVFNLHDLAQGNQPHDPTDIQNSQGHNILTQRQRLLELTEVGVLEVPLDIRTKNFQELFGQLSKMTQEIKTFKMEIEQQEKKLPGLEAQTKKTANNINTKFFGRDSITGDFALGNETTTNINAGNRDLQQLNIVTKLFSKVPYSALLEDPNNRNTTYLSLPQAKTLDQKDVNRLMQRLDAVIKDPGNTDLKHDLFRTMVRTDNSMLQNVIQQSLSRNRHQPELKNILDNKYNDKDLNSSAFRNFARDNFNRIFSDQELNSLKGTNLTHKVINIIPENYQPQVHVEMRGVNYLVDQKVIKEGDTVDVGLANPKNLPPKCCGGCTVERDVINPKIKINVAAVSKDNLPPGNYLPSKMITSEPQNLEKFVATLNPVFTQKAGELQNNSNIRQYGKQKRPQLSQKTTRLNDLGIELQKLSEANKELETFLSKKRKAEKSLEDCINKKRILETDPKLLVVINVKQKLDGNAKKDGESKRVKKEFYKSASWPRSNPKHDKDFKR